MYEQYNVAQIKTNQLAREVKDAQEKYNAALAQFGPQSAEAAKAQKELQDASAKLAEAQKQNVLQMIGFIGQAPSFLKNILDVKTNFQMLAFQLKQVDWAGFASSAQTALTSVASSVTTLSLALGSLVVVLGTAYKLGRSSWDGIR